MVQRAGRIITTISTPSSSGSRTSFPRYPLLCHDEWWNKEQLAQRPPKTSWSLSIPSLNQGMARRGRGIITSSPPTCTPVTYVRGHVYVFSAYFILPCRCSVHNSSYLNPLRGAGIVVQAVRAPDPGLQRATRQTRVLWDFGHLSEHPPLRKTNKLPTSVELSKPIMVMLLWCKSLGSLVACWTSSDDSERKFHGYLVNLVNTRYYARRISCRLS